MKQKILNLLNNSNPELRLEGLNLVLLQKNPEMYLPLVIKLLNDDYDYGRRGSAFGPTHIDPEKDLPVASQALECLVSIGSKSIPFLLPMIKEYPRRVDEYLAVIALGKLKARDALEDLFYHILEYNIVNHRVNFDQVDVLPIYEKAAISIHQIDETIWINFVKEIQDGSWFLRNTKKKYNEQFIKKLINQLNEQIMQR
jgi:HEAT repeat protein